MGSFLGVSVLLNVSQLGKITLAKSCLNSDSILR